MDITGIRTVISRATEGIVGIFDKANSEAENEAENEQQNMGQQGDMQTARDMIGRPGGGQGQGISRGHGW